MEWLQALLPAFLGAVLSALGMGGGGVLLIYLTAFRDMPQVAAQGVNLAFFIPVAAVSLAIHVKNRLVDYKLAAILIPGGIIGVFAGSKLADMLPEGLLRKCFAVFLLFIGLRELWAAFHTTPKSEKKPKNPDETQSLE